jgi:hypothetical protein
MKDEIDANLGDVSGTVTRIAINLGVNEIITTLPAEATWKADYTSIIDSLRAKWPTAEIWLAKPWAQGEGANSDTIAGWIDDIVGGYVSGVAVGPDERTWLENGDDGATYTTDGVHYSSAAQPVCAAEWLAVMTI